MQILVDLGRLAGQSAGLPHLLDQVVTHVARAVEVSHVKVLEYRATQDDLLIVAGVGWKAGVVGAASLSADMRSPPGRAYQTAEAVTVEDFGVEQNFDPSPLLREHGIVSLCNVPILVDGAAWGVLEVDSTVPRDFTEETFEFLRATAGLVGTWLGRTLAQAQDAVRIAAALNTAENQAVQLRELQHRAKNNFQLILSSISFERNRAADPAVAAALDKVVARVGAMALAHEQLQVRDGGKVLQLARYLQALCQSIKRQFDRIEIDVVADEVALQIDRAVPLGIILNELVTNAIKHAFDAKGGRIGVELRVGPGPGEARMVVRDNGRGISERAAEGTGLQLVRGLARWAGGDIALASTGAGTTVTIRFTVVT